MRQYCIYRAGVNPIDTGFIISTGDDADGEARFLVEDIISIDGMVRNLHFYYLIIQGQ